VVQHGRERTADQNPLLAELLDHALHRAIAQADHEEVGLRRNDRVAPRLEHLRGLVAHVEDLGLDVGLGGLVLQRGHGAPLGEHVDAVGRVDAHVAHHLRRRDRVADAHGGQRRDLREGAGHDDRAAFLHVGNRGAIGRIVHEVVVGLVDQHRHVLRDVVEQVLDFLGGDDRAGRVVRVAHVDEADVARVAIRRLDHLADVLPVVLGQRDLNGVGLHVGRLLEDAGVRRADAQHLLPGPEIGRGHHVQALARPGGQQDVLAPDAVVIGNDLHDVAVRVAVAVGVLPGVVHGLHDRRWRAIVVLVAGQLDEGVVLGLAARELRGLPLREQFGIGTKTQGADGSGHSPYKLTTRKRRPDVHTPSRK